MRPLCIGVAWCAFWLNNFCHSYGSNRCHSCSVCLTMADKENILQLIFGNVLGVCVCVCRSTRQTDPNRANEVAKRDGSTTECGRRLGYVAYALRLCVVYDKRQRSAHITGRLAGLRADCANEMNAFFGAEFIITRILWNSLLHSVYFFTFGSAPNNTCCIQVERLRTQPKWLIVLNRLWFFWNDKAHTSGEWNEMWFFAQVKREVRCRMVGIIRSMECSCYKWLQRSYCATLEHWPCMCVCVCFLDQSFHFCQCKLTLNVIRVQLFHKNLRQQNSKEAFSLHIHG